MAPPWLKGQPHVRIMTIWSVYFNANKSTDWTVMITLSFRIMYLIGFVLIKNVPNGIIMLCSRVKSLNNVLEVKQITLQTYQPYVLPSFYNKVQRINLLFPSFDENTLWLQSMQPAKQGLFWCMQWNSCILFVLLSGISAKAWNSWIFCNLVAFSE